MADPIYIKDSVSSLKLIDTQNHVIVNISKIFHLIFIRSSFGKRLVVCSYITHYSSSTPPPRVKPTKKKKQLKKNETMKKKKKNNQKKKLHLW